jgi:hypothetical protein
MELALVSSYLARAKREKLDKGFARGTRRLAANRKGNWRMRGVSPVLVQLTGLRKCDRAMADVPDPQV